MALMALGRRARIRKRRSGGLVWKCRSGRWTNADKRRRSCSGSAWCSRISRL